MMMISSERFVTNTYCEMLCACLTYVFQILYCLCLYLYDAALWNVYHTCTLDKLNSAYKCIKFFFEYNRRYNVTSMLKEISPPTLSDLIHKYRISFNVQLSSSDSIVNLVSGILV